MGMPVLVLSSKVRVRREFREDFNRWLLERFGRNPWSYVETNKWDQVYGIFSCRCGRKLRGINILPGRKCRCGLDEGEYLDMDE